MEEIKKILELLEKGKISSEEAEKLIRAVREADKNVRVEPQTVTGILSDLGHFVSSIVSTSVKSAIHYGKRGKMKGEIEIPYYEEIFINAVASNVEICQEKRGNIYVEYSGTFRYKDNKIDTKSGRVEIYVPEKISLNMQLVGANAEIEGDFEKIDIKLKGASLEAEIDFKNLYMDINSGNVEIETPEGALSVEIDENMSRVNLPKEFKKIDGKYIYGENPERFIKALVNMGSFELSFKKEEV